MNRIQEARQAAGLSRKEMAEKFKIPYRTLQNWELGLRECPEWAEMLIVEKLNSMRGESKMTAKKDITTKIYKDVFGIDEDHGDVNKFMKAVIVNFGDERGDIIVENDNFGTRRKYADFTEGKKKAGLHPGQIVFSGIEFAKVTHERYIDKDGNVQTF